jgi:hypothetical protein
MLSCKASGKSTCDEPFSNVHQMTPGFRRIASVWLYFAVPSLTLLAADTWLFGYPWNPKFVPLALSCWEIGVACTALCAPFFWLALRRDFSLNPVGHGATAGPLAGLVGVTVLEIYIALIWIASTFRSRISEPRSHPRSWVPHSASDGRHHASLSTFLGG